MKTKTLVLAASLVTFLSPALAAEGDEKAADAAAIKWLGLVDKGQYKQSWEQAAAYFKQNVKRDQWEAQAKGVRSPLGKVLSRTLKSSKSLSSLPGAPDGQYVVLQYSTSFEKKAAAVETVTPMKDKGVWRVSGYYIR